MFLQRLGDVVRLAGFLVNPAEIEETLQGHSSVAAAQVVAATTGEGVKPVAFVILRAGARLDQRALIAHCAARIANFKVPVRLVAVDEFPVTPGANATKVQRHKLKAMAEALLRRA